LIGPEMIYLINIGDSRAIITSNDGTVVARTEGKMRNFILIFSIWLLMMIKIINQMIPLNKNESMKLVEEYQNPVPVMFYV
jgi:hypothetical protein